MNLYLQSWRGLALALGLALAFTLGGCGGDDGDDGGPTDVVSDSSADTTGDVVTPADAVDDMATPDDVAGDAATDAGPVGGLALVRAFSGDGATVVATFSAALDEATVAIEDFSIVARDDDAAGPAVTAAAVDGRTVTLTLAEALPDDAASDLLVVDVTDADGETLDPAATRVTIAGTLYVALVWHQHQPVYIEPDGDYLRGPWVRKHATKDYFDMAEMVGRHPDIHVMVNLTPVLLMQLQTYYLDRLAPFVDVDAGTVDEAGYFAQPAGEDGSPITDPWVDLLLRDTPAPADLTPEQRGWFWEDIWSTFSISEVMIARFPEYEALLDQRDTAPETFTQEDLLNMKGWFQLAWFDPMFLRGPVTMPDGSVVDLSDLVTEDEDGVFTLNQPFTEEICERLVVEDYKVMANVVGIHRALLYDPVAKTGQIEVMTTPFYHPILPLIVDTELASIAGTAPLPDDRFQYPDDAQVHVAKAIAMHQDLFGQDVTGMWPAEGSVAEAVVPIFAANGVRWIATDRRVLERSTPPDQPIYSPYRVDADEVEGDGGDTDDELAIVFRDTELSDKIGFHFQGGTVEENAADFMADLRKHAGPYGEGDRLFTIILDGENAWEWYRLDNDARGFLNEMYVRMTEAQETGELRTTTVSEYLDGNDARGVPAHPVHDLPELEPLHAGSWIGGDYGIWIGEPEENLAWTYLARTRADLEQFAAEGLERPAVDAEEPEADTPAWYAWKAWETMYAAEGSDWFWWYGGDQTAVGGDDPFDRIFRELLKSVYRYAQAAGIDTDVPAFPPVLRVCEPPGGPLAAEPTIDGMFDPDDGGDVNAPNEWTLLGSGVCMDLDSGAELLPEDDIAVWYHGVTEDALFVALRLNDTIGDLLETDAQVRLYFSHKHIVSLEDEQFEQDPNLAETRTGAPIGFTAGGAAREVVVDFSGVEPAAQLATVDGGAWGEPAAAPDVVLGWDFAALSDIIELKIPFDVLNYQDDDPLEMLIVTTQDGSENDRVPEQNGVTVFVDRSLLVAVTIVCDATGQRLSLEAVKPIDNPPPPDGTGTVFIVGGRPEFGDWTPNTIPMADDGETHGDATAGDNLWTFRLMVPPLTELQYKFTIGDEGDGWGPTEEFPLTNRGLLVEDENGDLTVEVIDVFADRPDPSGSMGDLTEIVNP